MVSKHCTSRMKAIPISQGRTSSLASMNRVIDYLSGLSFDGGLKVSIHQLGFGDIQNSRAGLSRKGGRNDAILRFIEKTDRVLHVGCVDHPPLIEQKIEAGTYLHKLLEELVSQDSLFGFDVNEEGLEAMRGIGFKNLTSSFRELP